MPASERKPKMNSLLICERVIREVGTGQVSLVGLFESAASTDFPLIIPLMYAYAKMTDAQGEYVFKLELVRRDDMSLLGEAVLEPSSTDDPMAHTEAIFRLTEVVFDRAGYYDFRLWANDVMFLDSKGFLAERRER